MFPPTGRVGPVVVGDAAVKRPQVQFACQKVGEGAVHDAPGLASVLLLAAQEPLPALQGPPHLLFFRLSGVGRQPRRRHRLARRPQPGQNRLLLHPPLLPLLVRRVGGRGHPRPEGLIVPHQAPRQSAQVQRIKARLLAGDVGQDIVQVLEVPLAGLLERGNEAVRRDGRSGPFQRPADLVPLRLPPQVRLNVRLLAGVVPGDDQRLRRRRVGVGSDGVVAGAVGEEDVSPPGQTGGEEEPVGPRRDPVRLVQAVYDHQDRLSICPLHGFLQELEKEAGIFPGPGGQMVVGEVVAGDQLGAEVVEALVGPGDAHRGVHKVDGGMVPFGDLGGDGRLAQPGVGDDPKVGAGVLAEGFLQPVKEELAPHEPLCDSLNDAVDVVDIVLQRGIALEDGLVNGVVVAGDDEAAADVPADMDRAFFLEAGLLFGHYFSTLL